MVVFLTDQTFDSGRFGHTYTVVHLCLPQFQE